MSGEGQMILLSALVASLCLIMVVACITAVDDRPCMESGYLSKYSMENIRWAQDSALQKSAFYYSTYPWDSRAEAALRFKSEANSSMNSLSMVLLKHGVVFQLAYNDSLADEYIVVHPGNDTENIGGILVERVGDNVKIRGCAYDAFADNGDVAYRTSKVRTFD